MHLKILTKIKRKIINVEFIYTTGTCTVGNRDYKKACNQTRTSAFKCFQWESTCTTLSASCFLTYLFSVLIVLNECTTQTGSLTCTVPPTAKRYFTSLHEYCTYSYVIQVFSA